VSGWVKIFSTFNELGWDGSNCKKSVLKYINITSIAYLHCLLRFLSGLVLLVPELVACSMSASPDYTASMTISKTERSRVRNIYGNAVTPAFPLARHIFMGMPFPCKNIYGNGVPAPLHPCCHSKNFIFSLTTAHTQHLHRESKKQDTKLLAITSLIIIRFSKFFH